MEQQQQEPEAGIPGQDPRETGNHVADDHPAGDCDACVNRYSLPDPISPAILIVDNDQQTHAADRLALSSAVFDGAPPRILAVASPAEALFALRRTPNIGVLVTAADLLTADDGLRLIQEARRDLQMTDLRIILRGDRPAAAVMRRLMDENDIFDWREPADFAFDGLAIALRAALSAWRDRQAAAALQRGLRQLADILAAYDRSECISSYPVDILRHITALVRASVTDGDCRRSCGLVAERIGGVSTIAYGEGAFASLEGQRLGDLTDPQVIAAIDHARAGGVVYADDGVALHLPLGERDGVTAYLPHRLNAAGPTARLLEIYRLQMTAALARGHLADRLRRETRLRRAAEKRANKLAQLPEADPDPVMQIGLDGAILYANDAALALNSDWRRPAGAIVPAHWMAAVREAQDGDRKKWFNLRLNAGEFDVMAAPAADASHINLFFRNVSDIRQAERDASFLLSHDPLTGLANRSGLRDALATQCARMNGGAAGFAVIILDLDGFAALNDSEGHTVCDGVLRVIAQRLRGLLRPHDVVCRIGSDDFALLIPDLTEPADADALGARIATALAQPISVEGALITTSAAIGMALAPRDGREPRWLLRNATLALQAARSMSDGRACQFRAHDGHDDVGGAADIGRGLMEQEFVLFYQPKVRTRDGVPYGAEALLRWRHPQKGLLSPDNFIAAAERSGLIVALGGWVIDEACRQLGQWRRGPLGRLQVAVNMSAAQLRDEGLLARVQGALTRHRVRPGRLKLEITESTAMNNLEQATGVLSALRALGIELSIDDFGSGYSSLSQLRRMPFNELKIDGSFIHDIDSDADSRTVTRTIISLGHTLGMTVVAECVERPAQARLLHEMGCDYGQGYLYARPQPADDFARLLESEPHLVRVG